MTVEAAETKVVRTTLAFDENEDRISLTCALNNDQVLVLWLTQRLTGRLVPHLLNFVSPLPELEDVGIRQQAAETKGSNIDKVAAEEKTGQAISEPKQLIIPEAPVIATASTPSRIVAAVDITNGPMFVRLSFRGRASQMPTCLSLEHAQLARWLEGLRHCYLQAGWSMDAWSGPRSAELESFLEKSVVVH